MKLKLLQYPAGASSLKSTLHPVNRHITTSIILTKKKTLTIWVSVVNKVKYFSALQKRALIFLANGMTMTCSTLAVCWSLKPPSQWCSLINNTPANVYTHISVWTKPQVWKGKCTQCNQKNTCRGKKGSAQLQLFFLYMWASNVFVQGGD